MTDILLKILYIRIHQYILRMDLNTQHLWKNSHFIYNLWNKDYISEITRIIQINPDIEIIMIPSWKESDFPKEINWVKILPHGHLAADFLKSNKQIWAQEIERLFTLHTWAYQLKINGSFIPKAIIHEVTSLKWENRNKAFKVLSETIWKYSNFLWSIQDRLELWQVRIQESRTWKTLFIADSDELVQLMMSRFQQSKNNADFVRKIFRFILFSESWLSYVSTDFSSVEERKNLTCLQKVVFDYSQLLNRTQYNQIKSYIENEKNHNAPHYSEIQNLFEAYKKSQIRRIILYVQAQFWVWETRGWEESNFKNSKEKRALWWDKSLNLVESWNIRAAVFDIIRFASQCEDISDNILTIEDIDWYSAKALVANITDWFQWWRLFPRILADYCSGTKQRQLKWNFSVPNLELQEEFHVDFYYTWMNGQTIWIQTYTWPERKVTSKESSLHKHARKQNWIEIATQRWEKYKVFDAESWEVISEYPLSIVPEHIVEVQLELSQRERDELREYFDQYKVSEEKHILDWWEKTDNIVIEIQQIWTALNKVLEFFSIKDEWTIKRLLTDKIIFKGLHLSASALKSVDGLEIQVIKSSRLIGTINILWNFEEHLKACNSRPKKRKVHEKKGLKRKRHNRKNKEYPGSYKPNW